MKLENVSNWFQLIASVAVVAGLVSVIWELQQTKLLYLVTSRAAKKWTRPIKSWPQALNQFALHFEGRLPV